MAGSWFRAVWLQEMSEGAATRGTMFESTALRCLLACQQAEMCIFQFLLRMGSKNLGVLEVLSQEGLARAMTLWENHLRGKT